MEALKIAVFIFGLHQVIASEQSHKTHLIPVEGYETKLHVLGQHVEIPETPVKVIKITKTVAVKIPVPYPVKVKEKVPYPVHVAKPYPVPVTQIIKVPYVVKVPEKSVKDWSSVNDHHGYAGADGPVYGHQQTDGGETQGEYNSGHGYEIQDPSSHQSYAPSLDGQSLEGSSGEQGQYYSHGDEHAGSPYKFAGHSFGSIGDNSGKLSYLAEDKNYDDAINEYLKNNNHGSAPNGLGNHHLSKVDSLDVTHSHY